MVSRTYGVTCGGVRVEARKSFQKDGAKAAGQAARRQAVMRIGHGILGVHQGPLADRSGLASANPGELPSIACDVQMHNECVQVLARYWKPPPEQMPGTLVATWTISRWVTQDLVCSSTGPIRCGHKQVRYVLGAAYILWCMRAAVQRSGMRRVWLLECHQVFAKGAEVANGQRGCGECMQAQAASRTTGVAYTAPEDWLHAGALGGRCNEGWDRTGEMHGRSSSNVRVERGCLT